MWRNLLMLGHNFFQICNYMISPDLAHWGLPHCGKNIVFNFIFKWFTCYWFILFCDNLKVLVLFIFFTVYTGCITLFYRKCYFDKWFSFKVFVSVWTFKWCRYIVNSCILVLISSHWFLSGLGPCTECLALWTLVHCWRLLGVLYYMKFCILLFFSLSPGHLFHISVFSI